MTTDVTVYSVPYCSVAVSLLFARNPVNLARVLHQPTEEKEDVRISQPLLSLTSSLSCLLPLEILLIIQNHGLLILQKGHAFLPPSEMPRALEITVAIESKVCFAVWPIQLSRPVDKSAWINLSKGGALEPMDLSEVLHDLFQHTAGNDVCTAHT